LDYLLGQGPKGLEVLAAAISRGPAGLKFVAAHPGLSPRYLGRAAAKNGNVFAWAQDKYQGWRLQYGALATALKYLVLAVCAGLLVLVLVPGRYLEKLIARPGGPVATPGVIHYLLSALAVGVVLSAVAYIFSLSVRPLAEPLSAAAVTGEAGTAVAAPKDSALLSGTMVLLSLAIHAVVWFLVRGKIRAVEDDEKSAALLRLKRLENLDVFLDLPLFTGLALTVIAFILITLDAGMSRHFAYTATVVGILSSVSLRIRYLYPLKERLIQSP
jgi:hypothetical protein